MKKRDEISSTEQLLDLIRDDSSREHSDFDRSAQKKMGPRLKGAFKYSVPFKKTISVGVDLGHDDLKLIKINRISDQKYEMLEYARVPFEADISRENSQFYQFLRSVLASFCGSLKNQEIWCTIPSARVETRQLRIPKVSQKQIANTAYWSYQKLSSFNEKEKLFDFELLGEVDEGKTTKIDVMAYTALQAEIKDLKDLFNKAGFPLTGISIVPFAFQTLLRAGRIETQETHVSSLYIGRDWSRIDIFSEGNLMLSRGIKAGVKTMIEALRTEIEGNLFELSIAKSPTKDTAGIKAIKKKLKYELDHANQLFFGIIHANSPSAMDDRQRLLKEDKIFKMILPALERLIRQVERTIRHFSLNYDNSRVGKIFISSGVNPHNRIIEYIGEELGISTATINPFVDSSNFVSLTPGPELLSEQNAFVPAMGMALSSNSLTPNFLYTYKDKQITARSQRINRGVIVGFFLVMVLCVGVSFWQKSVLEKKEYQKRLFQQQLESISVQVDQNLVLKLVDDIQSKNREIQLIGQKYFGLAVVSEITDLTPENVRLISLAAHLGGDPADKEPKKVRELVLNGIVKGDRMILDSTLAGYLLQLKNSPLFDKPTINKKSFEQNEDVEVLKFTARLKLI
ncbi:MAG: pilus assembly protein PilM [bacterium]|nr:pilus assembly protein PilM [bacterium]